jgi:hypothetical protein
MKIQKTTSDPEQIKKLVKGRVVSEQAAQQAKGDTDGQEQPGKPDQDGRKSEHFMKDGFLCRWKSTQNGDVPIKICNFDARIVEQHILDNGIDTSLTYVIEGKLHGKTPLPTLDVAAEKFPGMAWTSRWGAASCLQSGQTVRDACRYAIQEQSHDIKTRTYYTHTGWRLINGKSVYLHGAGAIGCDDAVSVKLPEGLERYCFPPSPSKDSNKADLQAAIAASLSFLDIAKKRRLLCNPLSRGYSRSSSSAATSAKRN